MNKSNYSLTFACYNSVAYTKLCIESMIKHGTPLDRLVVVDNGSTDETREYLQKLPLGGKIYNTSNLGCGVAWNQGILLMQSEWSIIMNNDVVVSNDWIVNLLKTAELNNIKIISPALIEGELDYDFDSFVNENQPKMSNTHRVGHKHAVCLAVHKSVWHEIGYFQPVPKLLGYEDTLFFHQANKQKINMAMTGASWLHHFGSVTQTAMKIEQGLSQKDHLGYRYNYKLLNQGWAERKIKKMFRKKQENLWRKQELSRFGMTIHGIRKNQVFDWI